MNTSATLQRETMLLGRKYAPAWLGRVLVLGLGKSGLAAATYFADLLSTRVDELVLAPGADTPKNREQAKAFEQRGIAVVFGESVDPALGRFDLCVASPGISQFGDFYQSALAVSDEVISEVEFAWRESDANARWVGITGTNGKTTTTSLIAHVLQHCGLDAAAVGNIGDTCLDAVAHRPRKVYVAELSSFQLASTRLFVPDVAVLLNITPDHLAWHQGMDNYIDAKKQVFARLPQTRGTLVLDAANDVVRSILLELKRDDAFMSACSYLPLGTVEGIGGNMHERCGSEHAAFLGSDGFLTIRWQGERIRLLCKDELKIPGEHNVSNALAAAAACLALGASAADVARGLASFEALEHRLEFCGTIHGVRCYNDSKATNVDATLKALAAFEPERPVVLLGGTDKGTDLAELVDCANEHCQAVVCYGEAGPRFLEAFHATGSLPVEAAEHMNDAFECACALAPAGGIVLLSPACASFDEFTSFEHRGRVFKELVRTRAQQEGE